MPIFHASVHIDDAKSDIFVNINQTTTHMYNKNT